MVINRITNDYGNEMVNPPDSINKSNDFTTTNGDSTWFYQYKLWSSRTWNATDKQDYLTKQETHKEGRENLPSNMEVA